MEEAVGYFSFHFFVDEKDSCYFGVKDMKEKWKDGRLCQRL